MLYKIHTKRLIKKGISLNKNNTSQLSSRIEEFLKKKNRCVVLVVGSPGSGKSTLARFIKQKGFLTIPEKQLVIIDDLRGQDKKKYRKQELPILIRNLRNQVLVLFDYRAALYLKRADIVLLTLIKEEERLRYLKKRSAWGYKTYKRRFYRTPPVPFSYDKKRLYICAGDILNIFNGRQAGSG